MQLTVKELKNAIQDLQDDSLVYFEHIDDEHLDGYKRKFIFNDSHTSKDLYDFCKNPRIKYCNLSGRNTLQQFNRYILDIPNIRTYTIDLSLNVPRDIVINMFLKELAKDISFEYIGEKYE